jgi:hypothetical protein
VAAGLIISADGSGGLCFRVNAGMSGTAMDSGFLADFLCNTAPV